MSGILHRSKSEIDSSSSGVKQRGDAVRKEMDALVNIPEENGSTPTKGGPVSPSPLRIFSQAKKKMNEIFIELDAQVKESTAFLKRISQGVVPVNLETVDHVEKQYSKIKGITEMVARDHMKVVFFGRTSNGKSTVINAMLRDKILPSGIGHTTSCFIQVEGTDEPEGYAQTEGSDEKFGVSSVANLSHALNQGHLGEESLVRLHWPKNKCFLLREDVVLVDSPGIDVTPDTDIWIDKYCLDADVFVLVANSESTLMQAEKNFFHKVSTRLSKPNVFILNNRWDASANEPEFMDEVRRQHLDRNLEFLTKELGVISNQQALERVYFVSAKEVLMTAQKKQQNAIVNPGAFPDGYLMRMQDFDTFERKFQECLSKSAVRTKFEHHTQQGRKIAHEMRNLLEEVYEQSNLTRALQEEDRLRQESLFHLKTTHFESMSVDFKEKIDALSRKAGQEIIAGFKEELARLQTTVNLYTKNWPMTVEQMHLYKLGLYEVFERNLLRNFEARCSVPINNAVDMLEQEMLTRFGGLLPENSRDVKLAPLHRRQRFNVKVHLSIPQMCIGFTEDLTFHFSLGWQRIARLLLSRNEMRRLATFGFLPMSRNVEPNASVSPGASKSTDSGIGSLPPSNSSLPATDGTTKDLDVVELAAILSKCGIGTGAVAFMVWRSIGWKILVGAAASYGILYGAERLAWHFSTRRRVFKHQFVDFVKPQLASLVHPSATSGAHQVQEELEFTFTELIRLANESTTELSERIAALRKEVKTLDEVTSQAKVMNNKSKWLESQLDSFWDAYIASKDVEDVVPDILNNHLPEQQK
ncbi:Mitofusin-2 [Hypsibius exemplaris]|uniref:Mitofusin-2 n=1 Tax=Hypsibius exemplaris TaxID=2072580 RepID=A0A1W0WU70_HYPEX|nr:Mitofusin-2 [Hypsibius exemplaris]